MRQQAMQFAESYRVQMERVSAHVRESVRHPSLYVFVGDCDGTHIEKIEKYARDIMDGGVFFLRLFQKLQDETPDETVLAAANQSIRHIKAQIQRNEDRINVKRINISVIVEASSPAGILAETAGLLLKDIFEEDFPIVHSNLYILLSEANGYEDFEQRSARAMRMLLHAQNFQREDYAAHLPIKISKEGRANVVTHEGSLFNLAFLLSDRNEQDVVSDENQYNNYRIICHSQFLNHTDSHFEDTLRKKSFEAKTPFFVTAGMTRLVKPHADIAYTAFRYVYGYLLKLLRGNAENFGSVSLSRYIEMLENAIGSQPSDEQLTGDILSAAFRKNLKGSLRGKNLRQAEELLFGDGALRFYDANYAKTRYQLDLSFLWENVKTDMESAEAGAYAVAALDLEPLQTRLRLLNSQIEQWDREILRLYEGSCRIGLWQNIESIKRDIAAVYVLRRRRDLAQALYANFCELRDFLDEQSHNAQARVKILEEAAASLAQVPDPGHHVDAYYKQAVSGVMAELSARHGSHCFLHENFIGSADGNMESMAERIVSFIHKYLFTHEVFQLSFDEDLHCRSIASPGEYDGAFTHMDEFYRQLLSDADQQAALAASLQRYDGLVREKYYFGSLNGMFMGYARQFCQNTVGEAAYFLDEDVGFTLIRLAGGFTVENLTRYRTLYGYYAEAFLNDRS